MLVEVNLRDIHEGYEDFGDWLDHKHFLVNGPQECCLMWEQEWRKYRDLLPAHTVEAYNNGLYGGMQGLTPEELSGVWGERASIGELEDIYEL